jgi:alkylation response protein AidB-like acyl-CoA dehydrogenase
VKFDYSEEQQLLADSVRRFISQDYAFDARRKIVASPEGSGAKVWSTLAELGLLGIPFSSDDGGFGGGAVDLLSVMEAFGEGLVVEPYLSTLIGAQFVARAGSDAMKQRILPAVIEGKLKMAFAHTEKGARYDLSRVSTSAAKSANGFVINGEKLVVLHAPLADKIVLSASNAPSPLGEGRGGGHSLFLVDAKSPGISMKPFRTFDEMPAADISFGNVAVPADALIGREGAALPLIEDVIDFATALVCAEAVGAIKFANDTTLEYLKTRKQFGVPIGSFQALQHRMVDMVISYEQAKSMASLACAKVDSEKDPAERKRVVSAAKIRIADACRHVSQESVQLHGGMGMSEELKVSHTFRRLTAIAQQFGDADHHLARFSLPAPK